ncbi:COX15/CtaA family protein [Devosia sp. XJ19-1]|uniref:Heme A synthase n=1 Tax=Devosia ureilytica TaxID=2952754 RepID=A0A9Q4AL12_9HYPH|nr:COX15/CtaA family protein [Devosia ureilytica]MCP8882478.1 COX15/CtaA family protein [Devosia ureilytica]MCP8885635.1 COX15/CtaA family protein [Devosia ureilytica]
MQDAAPGQVSYASDRLRPVRIWLYGLAAFVLLIVVVGGITRLTESGLSITSWKPLSGVIPPLNDAEWQAEFEAYQQIPQYSVLNSWMSLSDFQYIFFWEWFHRLIARFLGVLFIVPFVVFLVQKRLSRELALPLFGLFVLGGFQGALGWWMVSSGLTELTSVSQYRLAAHLTAASLLFIALIYVARSLSPGRVLGRVTSFHMSTGVLLLVAVILQIGAGAFVAGLDAGMGYNTWPLMDGAIIPNGLLAMDPVWRNLFENALTVQFIHRGIAYLIVAYLGYLLWRRQQDGGFAGVHGWLPRIGFIVLLQVGLGVATLLMSVPIGLAVGHQALAFMLAGLVTAYVADLRRVR